MKKYERPMVIENDVLAESIYMASGSVASGNCYTFSAEIVQKPETGNEVYTIQMNGQHNATHHSSERTVVVCFNQPVEYVSSNAAAVSGSATSTLTLTFTDGVNGSYHNNATDNIGLGQLTVKSEPGLAITSVTCSYCNEECGQAGH